MVANKRSQTNLKLKETWLGHLVRYKNTKEVKVNHKLTKMVKDA